MIRIGGEYIAAGEVTVRRDPPGWLVMSRYPSGKDALLEAVAANLRDSGFLVMTTENVMPYKWGKLMANLVNAVGAITNAREKENTEIIQATVHEAENILKQAGIRWVSAKDLEKEWARGGPTSQRYSCHRIAEFDLAKPFPAAGYGGNRISKWGDCEAGQSDRPGSAYKPGPSPHHQRDGA